MNESGKKPLKDLCGIILQKQNSRNDNLEKLLADKINLRPTSFGNIQEDPLTLLTEIQSLDSQIKPLC